MKHLPAFFFSAPTPFAHHAKLYSDVSVKSLCREKVLQWRNTKLRTPFCVRSPFMLAIESANGQINSSCLERFNTWLQTTGVELINSEVREEDGLRGVYATHTIKKGEDIFKIPRKAALTVPSTAEKASDNLHIFSILDDEFWSSEPWYIRLAVKLLDEVARGDRSPFVHYINSLPSAPNAALWAIQASRKGSVNTAALSAVEQQLSKYGLLHAARIYGIQIGKSFESFRNALPEEQREYVTLRSFTWAVCIAVSRGFGVPPSSGESQDVECPSGGIKIPVVSKIGFHSNPPAYALFPGLDMTNHSIHSASELRYNEVEDVFYVRTGRPTLPGKEVFVSYGKKGNDDLVFFYGFSEGGSPYNEIRIYNADEWGHHLLNDRNSDMEASSKARKLEVIQQAGLLTTESCFVLRSDKLDDDLMRLLRVIVATSGELDVITQRTHQSQNKQNDIRDAFRRAVSLRNELEAWSVIECYCESMMKSQGGNFTDIERQRIAKLLQTQNDKKGDACSATWVWGEMNSDGELLYRWERALILEETMNRVRHFARISRAIGRVCTVLLPPSQSTLRTEAFQPFHDGGLPTFEISPDEIQKQLRN